MNALRELDAWYVTTPHTSEITCPFSSYNSSMISIVFSFFILFSLDFYSFSLNHLSVRYQAFTLTDVETLVIGV